MGFGDVTLMAMIGSFVGWQPSMIVFFMLILLTWLLLIDMLFNAFFIFISPLCLFLWSGHRLLASAVDCVPFVIESPKVTIAPVCLDANTSTPASQNHASVVESTGFGQQT